MSEELKLAEPLEVKFHLTHSAEIGKLAGALAKAQGAFEIVAKDSANPFFKSKYADLASVISATRKALAANEIAFIQSPGDVTGRSLSLTSMLIHSSGEWIRGELEMPLKEATAQGVGSAVTYARRYAEQSMLNVAGEDDDGEAATGRQWEASTDKSEKSGKTINPNQARAFWSATKQGGKSPDDVAEYFRDILKIANTEDMLKTELDSAMKWALKPADDLTAKLQDSVDDATRKKAMKRIFAAAGEKKIPEADVKSWAYEQYGVDSMTKLSLQQLEGVSQWIGTVE